MRFALLTLLTFITRASYAQPLPKYSFSTNLGIFNVKEVSLNFDKYINEKWVLQSTVSLHYPNPIFGIGLYNSRELAVISNNQGLGFKIILKKLFNSGFDQTPFNLGFGILTNFLAAPNTYYDPGGFAGSFAGPRIRFHSATQHFGLFYHMGVPFSQRKQHFLNEFFFQIGGKYVHEKEEILTSSSGIGERTSHYHRPGLVLQAGFRLGYIKTVNTVITPSF